MSGFNPINLTCLLATLLVTSACINAKPDLRKGEPLLGMQIYPDHLRSSLYYYGPGDITLMNSDEGRPFFHLLSTRYMGTLSTGDQGVFKQHNLVSFRMQLETPSTEKLKEIRKSLKKTQRKYSIELRPLPIKRTLAQVVYTPVRELKDEKKQTRNLPKGQFEQAEGARDGGYWRERAYTLRLSDEDAQLLRSALEDGQVILSMSYFFVARGIGFDAPLEEISGSPEILALIDTDKDRQESTDESITAQKQLDKDSLHTVKAGATTITLDTHRWPNLLQQIDINEQAPPGYAVLDVYSYDFQQGNNSDLYEKRIDIEAMSITSVAVRKSVIFSSDKPDRYVHQIRFPVAVKMDKPYRYRVVETTLDGKEQLVQDWQERVSWISLLDVTRETSSTTDNGTSPQ